MIASEMRRPRPAGFTLIEVLVALMIIMILGGIGVPQYFKIVEKGKATEANDAAMNIGVAQSRFYAKYGSYCTSSSSPAFPACSGFDWPNATLKFFTMASPAAIGTTGWSVTLTRNSTPQMYGAYVITATSSGGAPTMTCSDTSCVKDLLPH